MIRVFSPNDKIFTSNGDAVIQPFKAKVHKEDNGKFYLDIEADISYVDILTANRIIVADTPQGAQAFRIKNPEKTKHKITIKAPHISYDAENYVIADSYVVDNAFADDLGTTPYQDAGITLAKTSGYISAFAYNEKFDWLFFPSETSGDSSLPVGDYLYQSTAGGAWRVARLGGRWGDSSYGGGFFWLVSNTSSSRDRDIGGRLVYVPDTA